jgi:hypothetical protein
VPDDPLAQPTREEADRAVTLLRSFLPEASDVSTKFEDRIMFFDPGSNWSGVRCPRCGAEIEDWWVSAATRAYEASALRDLTATTPCCGYTTSLNDMNFVWNGAFGSFVLKAKNPNIRDTTPEQDAALSECLGMTLRKVLVHR